MTTEFSVLHALNMKITEAKDPGSDEEYQKFFNKMLKKFGAKSPADLDDKKKKEFYAAIDKGWNSDAESGKDGVTEAFKKGDKIIDIDSGEQVTIEKVTKGSSRLPMTVYTVKFKNGKIEARALDELRESDHEIPDDGEVTDKKAEKDDEKKDSGSQSAYKKFFQKILKKFGVSSPEELDDKKKKEFYAAIEAGWNSDDEDGPDGEIKETKSLAAKLSEAEESEPAPSKDEPKKRLIKKKEPEKKDGGDDADIKIDPRTEEDESEEITIDFPEGVFLEIEFEKDVSNDQVKVTAQKMYQAGANPVEIALDLAKEFGAIDWMIADISTKDDDDDDDDQKEPVKESSSRGLYNALMEVTPEKKAKLKAEQTEKVAYSKELAKALTKELGFKVKSSVIKTVRYDAYIQVTSKEVFPSEFTNKIAEVAGNGNLADHIISVLWSNWKKLGY